MQMACGKKVAAMQEAGCQVIFLIKYHCRFAISGDEYDFTIHLHQSLAKLALKLGFIPAVIVFV